MTLKGIKVRIYPNQDQQNKIMANFGYTRFVWNQMLNMLVIRYENNPKAKFLNAFALNNLLPAMKLEHPWLKDAESTSLQVVNHDLIEAYQKFFKEHHGFPKFKSRKFPKQSYQSKAVNHNISVINNKQVKLPKLGLLRFKSSRKITGKIKSVTIRLSATGKFYAILLVDTEITTLVKTKHAVGIDMGIADLMITSDGIKYPTIRFDKALSKKKHYWEKRLARRRLQAKKAIAEDRHHKVLEPREWSDFKNYQKAKLMVAKYAEKIANQRQNYLHTLSKKLVEQYDVIKIEDLKAKNLMKNHSLARAIANQSWRELRSQLEYKCKWYGKQLVTVNPRKTSQICADCGYDDGKHTLDIRQWTCPNCGINHDRDLNAAQNILKA
ncbi:RNA-guided endonuclease TnpB family protein [Pediococcus pentosaceus]|jgi:putative transposase|uniref:RNA-guided endonuclease TnpB family protein n=1 Tax=Pediococcus pentosaceus TaxID=1255 RepID=UPI0018FEC8C8|nr:RNA-guided endonuclease TnpB family protein [Pediococcus pentosaceus]MBF7122518.1 transposase [Pediococcus pentosaceus]MCS8573100.1 transposase [Pediococcus pentosaceus]MCT1176359.1 transposase [Pediococcus pentosaceus]MDB1561764.1 RNA-guided endonuclease TnpB family protein [Pediococcus pentosaceus]